MIMRIELLGAVTTVLFLCAAPTVAQGVPSAPDRPRVAIFFDSAFPSIDAPAPDLAALRAALAAFDVAALDSSALQAALDAGRADVLVLPYGSAFPQDSWPAIDRFLSGGGRFVNLGGVPFGAPVMRERGTWRRASRTTSYFKQLGIVQAFPVAAANLTFRAAEQTDEASQSLAADVRAQRIVELIVRFAATKSFPHEDGSDGPREACLVPLVHGFGAQALPVAAPFVQIDRLEGRFAGGRWLLATGDLGVSPRSAAALVARAAEGAAELRVQPRYAGFHPGEPIELTVSLRRPLAGAAAQADPPRADIQASDSAGRTIASLSVPLAVAGSIASAQVTLPIESAAMARGLYRLRASFEEQVGQVGQVGRVGFATSGFWIYDETMVRGGRALTAGRDYFARDGVPVPISGTTYMASDVHRRFLLEPNPWAWQRDFASMAQAGVNMVRTGIWTAWSEHSLSDGQPTEAMLRALAVFLLTARQHDIPIVFTFFAFVPPAWGGGNPYFDPRALDAQKRFAGTIAARLAGANDIVWDLINEPSFSSAQRLWQCRPNYDADEQAAWEAWLRDHVPAGDGHEREALLHERWNAVAGEGLALPALRDFRDANLLGLTRPNKAADYRRFAQDAFSSWVRGVSAAIRANGNRGQLITVGQDEGGAGERPNPLLFGDAVDFTGTHTWWNNDALLWDGLVSKRADRPALVEETGLMTHERPDGTAWRSEEDARNLLERKIALAVASGAAGFVQWLWNTNVYMPLDNEAGIGFLRADGTAKPEIEPFVRAASFLRAHRERFAGRALEDVAVIVPQSHVFSIRDQATAATQRAVRSLEYDLRVPVRIINEYATADLRRGARLLVLPSARILTESAWIALLAAVEGGSTLIVTGPIDRDEYERPVSRLASLGIHADARPVAPENRLRVDATTEIRVPFRGGKLERLERAVVNGGAPARVQRLRRGKGKIIWCPLPVELSDDDRAPSAVYRAALRVAGIRPAITVTPARDHSSRRRPASMSAGQGGRGPQRGSRVGVPFNLASQGILVRPLRFADSILLVVVNETNADADLRVRVDAIVRPVRVRVAAERATIVLVDKRTGAVIGTTQPPTPLSKP
jgi:hypothetical protein